MGFVSRLRKNLKKKQFDFVQSRVKYYVYNPTKKMALPIPLSVIETNDDAQASKL